MSKQQDVTVRLDDRVRLMSAVLAVTDWPQKSQDRKPHGTHAHSRATRKFLEPVKDHGAVQALQELLDSGAPLEAAFAFALQLHWPAIEADELPAWAPPRWDEKLRDFYNQSNLVTWWQTEDAVWQGALHQSEKMFEAVTFKNTLQPFFGEIPEKLVFIPSVSYPTDMEIALRFNNELVCIAPPRLAWGDSPPWPFDEDPGYIYRSALSQYSKLLVHAYLREHADKIATISETALPVSDQFRARFPTWQEQFTTLFVAAMSALYLEGHISKAETNAYVLMERKMHGMTSLPGMISVLRRYLTAYDDGKYKSMIDWLPGFPRQFKIAAKIVSL
ncbi:MAG: hypothetical protein R3E39_15345 [Anaerolineae bacterium]